MSTRLAELGEEDGLTAVISFVQGLLGAGQANFSAEAGKLVEAGRFDELIALLSTHIGLIVGAASKDAECCLAVMAHLVKKVATAGEDAELASASKLAAALTAKPEEAAETRLNGLLALYAAAKGSKAKFATLLQVLRFAARSKAMAAQLAASVRGHARDWARQWGLGDAQAYELYMAAAQLLKAVGDRTSQADYLRLATDGLALAPAGDAAAKAAALQAVKDWIAAADNLTCDFAGLPAVAALEKDAAAAPFLRLLTVMLAGDMAGFKAAATAAVLDAVPTTQEAATDKMRMMALLGVASKAAGGAVPLAEVQKALDVTAEQVQPLIIKAIGRKLLEGKIDQVAGTLTATRCHRRAFGGHEWGSLASQLSALGGALASISERLASVGGAPAPQQQHAAPPPKPVRA